MALALLATITPSSEFSSISSKNVTHTTDANTNVLVVSVAAGVTCSSITWNGVALTKQIENTSGFVPAIWTLVNPAIGTFTLAFTKSSSTSAFGAVAYNFSGANTSNPVDATLNMTTNTSDTITTTQNGCIILLVAGTNNGSSSMAFSTGTAQLNAGSGGGAGQMTTLQGNQSAPTSGSNTITFTNSLGGSISVALAVAPGVVAPSTAKFFPFLDRR